MSCEHPKIISYPVNLDDLPGPLLHRTTSNMEWIQICLSSVTVLLLLFVVLVIGYLGYAFVKYQNIFIDMLQF